MILWQKYEVTTSENKTTAINMTVAELRYLESMPMRLKGVEDQLKELNRNIEQLIKLLKNENKV